MGRTMNDMGDSDQHQVGIRVMEDKGVGGQILCWGPAPLQPFLVDTGRDLEIFSCTISEKVGENIVATITVPVAEIVMRVDEIPEAVKALHYPGPDKAKPLKDMGAELTKMANTIIEGPGFVERDDA